MGKSKSIGRIVVVSDHDQSWITGCLDAIESLYPDVEVYVVDRDSSDGSADAAIRHPVVDRVYVVPAGDLQAAVNAAAQGASKMVLLGADRRPHDGWLEAAGAALEHSWVAFGGDRTLGNFAVDLGHLGPVTLFRRAADLDDVLQRVRAAGGCWQEVPAMIVDAADAVVPRSGLPVTSPSPAAHRFGGLISVVVCTRDREDQLKRCLGSLGRLRDDDHEIVVVDNHELATVDERDCPPGTRVVHEPRRGLDVARNRGMAEASGAVIAYVDDDCEVDPFWLHALRVALADQRVGAVTGRVRPAHLTLATERQFEEAFGFDRGLHRRRFTPWDDRPWYPLWAGALGTGCNMAFRREELVGIGGFDELLDVGSTIRGGGDLDAFARLLDRGVIIEYTPDALVWHHHRRDPLSLSEQFRGYGESAGAILMKAVLERPGLRVQAVRFFGERLAKHLRMRRDASRGGSLLNESLARTLLWGQVAGPFRYLAARASSYLP